MCRYTINKDNKKSNYKDKNTFFTVLHLLGRSNIIKSFKNYFLKSYSHAKNYEYNYENNSVKIKENK